MKRQEKLIRVTPNSGDITSYVTDAIQSFASTLPAYMNPISGLLATGAVFSGMRVAKMGGEIMSVINAGRAKKLEEAEIPTIKLYETLRSFSTGQLQTDEELIDALRNLHILTFSQDTDSGELTEIYIAIDTVKKLNGPEINTLLAAYKITTKTLDSERLAKVMELSSANGEDESADTWNKMIMRACDYSTSEYIQRQESHLEEERLIASRMYEQHSIGNKSYRFTPTGYCRLTWPGYKLADYIVRGNALFDEVIKDSSQ